MNDIWHIGSLKRMRIRETVDFLEKKAIKYIVSGEGKGKR
jgi:hypothetical protein